MNQSIDEAVRVAVYDHFITCGDAPDAAELAQRLALTSAELTASYRRLAAEQALVLGTDDTLWMAIPFSATPTDVQVQGAEVSWWANCAFDGLGIPAMLDVDGVVTTNCPQSGAPIVVTVRDGVPASGACVLHMSVALAQWWDSIGDT